MSRTKQQVEADRLDCDLYRLISRATQLGWSDAASAMAEARTQIRKRMHPEDRKQTLGWPDSAKKRNALQSTTESA